MRNFYLAMALAVVAAGMFIIAPTSGDPNMATFAGKWVSMQNQYADGVNCSNGEPKIGMELYIQEQNPREVRLVQITGRDRLQFVFPIGGETPAPQMSGEESTYNHVIEVEVAGEVDVSGTLELPASTSEESQITSVTLSTSESSASVALPALGITKDKTLPIVMLQAISGGLPIEERIVLSADQFTRCFL